MALLTTDIAFTDEQAMLLETAIAFCRDKSPIRAVRTQIAHTGELVPPAVMCRPTWAGHRP